ncbi:MAG: nucleotidyltransferase domain-containing protein, partial [Actinomycetota bacterium]|nr:nucleotidyltransferase domain-containing protein [Actinomycetota bacterium]
MTTPADAVARRLRERDELIRQVRRWSNGLDAALKVRDVVVFGSVARGDFHAASDVDVLVVALCLPDHPHERLAALGDYPARVEPVVWTAAEYAAQLARSNPIALEVQHDG